MTPAIGTATAATNIIDNDDATSISIAADAPSVDEAAGTITFTVTRTGDAEGSQTVDYALTGVEAADISEPGHRHGDLRRRARPSRPSPSPLIDDALDEVDRDVTVDAVEPAGQRR